MAKAELGTKRLCPHCGAKYYDLNHNPITCPRCGGAFEPPTRGRAGPATAVVADDDAGDEEEEEVANVELVSLEEADEDAGAAVDGDEEEEVALADEEEEAFLPEEDEEGDDVNEILGDVDGEDEEP